jgi:hypothetical protein
MKESYGVVPCSTREGQRYLSASSSEIRYSGGGILGGDLLPAIHMRNAAVVAIAKMSRKNRGREVDGIERAFAGLAVMSFVALMASLTLLAIF